MPRAAIPLFSWDAVLMGRGTYDGFAPVWSAGNGDPTRTLSNGIVILTYDVRQPVE
jgi:hypothetical protein